MNDASSSSDNPRLDHDLRDDIPSVAPQSDDADIAKRRKRVQQDQKAAFLDHLIRNIDVVIYAQLSVLYYMDCTISRFIIRGLPHWFYFTPKPSIFPPPPPTHRPYIAVIFGTNIVCMLSHLFQAPLVAGEATRGYLHGGMLIDFVGQKSPVSRWRLVGLDLLVLLLQVLMLGITLERRAAKAGGEAVEAVEGVATEPQQDLDSEEQGVLRQDRLDPENVDGIELQDLHHSSSGRTGGDEDRERDELLAADTETGQADQHPLDHYYTGEKVVADLHIVETIQAQWQAGGVTAEGPGASAASGAQAAAVAAAAARRTFTFRLGEGIQTTS